MPPDPSRPTDPLLEAVRRRHPEVDVVVLPPVRPRGAPPTTPDHEVLAVVEAVRGAHAETTADEQDATSGPGGPAPAWVPAGEGWHRDPESGTDVLVSRSYLQTGAGRQVPALRRLGDRLLAAGWTAGPVRGRRPALAAVRDGVRTAAWTTEEGLGLATSGPPVAPDPDLRRRVEESR